MVKNSRRITATWVCLLLAVSMNLYADEKIPGQYSEEQIQQYKENFQRNAQVVLRTLDLWAKSWVYLNIDNYLSCYAADFVGEGYADPEAWRNSRRQRFSTEKQIELAIANMEVLATAPDTISVTFVQTYKSKTYTDKVQKQIVLKYIDNKWLITAEKILKTL